MVGLKKNILSRVGGAPMAFAVRMAGRGLAFVLAIFLTRILGAEQYGIYAYAVAWATVLMIPASLGYGSLLLRQVAVYLDTDRPELVRGLLSHAHRVVIPVSFGIWLIAAGVAWLEVDSIFLLAVLLILPTILFRSVSTLWVGVLQGLGHPDISFMPVFIFFPLGTMLIVGGLYLFGVHVGATLAVLVFLVMTAISYVISRALGRHYLKAAIQDAKSVLEDRNWLWLVVPFALVTFMGTVTTQVGVLVLGGFGEAVQVAVYQVAIKLAEPTSTVLLTIGVAVSPKIAGRYGTGDFEGMRQAIHHASRNAFFYSLPVAAVFIVFQHQLLGLFGSEFEAGGLAMTIIVISYLIYAFAGTADVALLMTDNVGALVKVRAVSLALNVAVCIALVPAHGATGAAIGMTAEVTLRSVILVLLVWRRLGANSMAIPWPRPA